MTWWKAIILGLIQGLTEFLPVSSSGHLVFAEQLLGIDESGAMFFFIMLHFATVVSICVMLTKSLVSLFKWPIPKKAWKILLASVPAAVLGIALNDLIEEAFGMSILFPMFLATAALLLITEIISKRRRAAQGLKPIAELSGSGVKAASAVSEAGLRDTAQAAAEESAGSGVKTDAVKAGAAQEENGVRKTENGDGAAVKNDGDEITLKQAVVMGCAQAVAIIPGISRSGSTICSGVLAGGDRKKVADFSFLMSIPVILGSAVWELIKMFRDNQGLQNINFFYLALGMCAAFLSGIFAIGLMLRLISKANYKWFSLYLVGISILNIILLSTGVM